MRVMFNRKINLKFILFFLINLYIPNTLASAFISANWQTTNGANVVFYKATSVDMLEIKVAFKAGSAFDGSNFGLSALTTRLMNKGNANLSANILAQELASTGAQYSYSTTRDMTIFNLQTLTDTKALNKAVNLFSLILTKPNFNYQEFLREKNQQLMEINQVKESPAEVANQAFFAQLYKDHPYAHPVNGDQEHIKEITRDDVVNFQQKYFTAKNATIIMVGAIDEGQAKIIAEKLIGKLNAGEVAATIINAPPLRKAESFTINFPSSQTILRIGQLGIDFHDSRYLPLLIGNYLLGGSNLVSRLGTEIREKRGLTYGVYSQFVPMLSDGPFFIGLATKNTNALEASRMIREILESFIKTGPSEHEVNAAKQYLTGSFPLALASNHSIATMLLKIVFYNLPEDYLDTYVLRINAVTTQEIKKAIQEVIHPHNLLQIAVGKL